MDYIRRYWHILAGLMCVAVLGFIYFRGQGAQAAPQLERVALGADAAYTVEPETVETVPDAPRDIVVHIEGAVNSPGVFTLPYGSRVHEVLALAGGATEDADLARVNLAAFLQDAQQVIIPTEADEIDYLADSAVDNQANQPGSGLININTADAGQLMTLPGIGPVLSGNIISHREANGPFDTVEQLINVPRIGTGILNNIRDLVTVN